jgi:hypothetical protein
MPTQVCAGAPSVLLRAAGNLTASDAVAAHFYVCDRSGDTSIVSDVKAWMAGPQIHLVEFYWYLFVVICVIGGIAGLYVATRSLRGLFVVDYKSSANKDSQPWSAQSSIKLYVPQVTSMDLRYPMIACDKALFDASHIPWRCDLSHWDIYTEASELFPDAIASDHSRK